MYVRYCNSQLDDALQNTHPLNVMLHISDDFVWLERKASPERRAPKLTESNLFLRQK